MARGLRKETLTKLRSPDQLDRSIRITSSRGWIAMLLLAVIAAATLLWSVFGSVDTRVAGLGIVLPSGGKVIAVSAVAGGQVREVRVSDGDRVTAGDVLVVIDRGADVDNILEAEQDLRAPREQLVDAKARSDALIVERTKTNEQLARSNQGKIATLIQRLNEREESIGGLKRDLRDGYVTRDTVEQARSEIDDLSFQIADSREKIAAIGDQIAPGQRAVDILSGERSLAVQSFFRAADGKRIAPGMRAQVAISAAEPSVYGTAIGEVTTVSELPVTSAFINDLVGNEELARQMMAEGSPIYVRIKFVEDTSTRSGIA